MSPEPLQGRLLVANPRLPDPNFDRTVVLLLAHGPDGAVGLVLNRPSDTSVAGALPGWEDVTSDPAVVFVGGPVERLAIVCLAQRAGDGSPADGWAPVAGPVGTFDLELGPTAAAGSEGLRIFAGYAGWGPGQLETEIEGGAWFVLEAQTGDATGDDPDSLWQRVLRRQRSSLALVAAYPADPAMN